MTSRKACDTLEGMERRGVLGTTYHPVSPIGELLAQVSKRWRLNRRLTPALLPEVWPDLVGEGVARHAAPLTLAKGELTLAVDSAVWMSELRYQIPTILARLNAALGAGKIKRLRLVQSPLPFTPPAKTAKGPAKTAQPLPSPPAEAVRTAQELADAVDDRELGETLKRAYLHASRLRLAKGKTTA